MLPDALFQTIAATETSQGVIALVGRRRGRSSSFSAARSLVVVLDGLQDPGNAGAIARAAEAFGATGADVPQRHGQPVPSEDAAGIGGLVVPRFRSWRARAAACGSGAARLMVVCGHAVHRFAAPGRGCRFRRACAIVIGSEGRGVSPELHALCEEVAIPPWRGIVERRGGGGGAALRSAEAAACEPVRRQSARP